MKRRNTQYDHDHEEFLPLHQHALPVLEESSSTATAASKHRHSSSGRRFCKACSLRCFLLLCMAIFVFTCNFFTTVFFTKRCIVMRLDLSPLVHRVLQRASVPPSSLECQWNLPVHGCTVNMCTVAHEGGEGKLYRGTCVTNNYDKTPTAKNILLKSTKISNRRSAATEVAAFRILESIPDSPLELLDSGINYLIMADLVDYRPVNLQSLVHDSPEPPFQTAMAGEYVRQVLAQLRHLHRGATNTNSTGPDTGYLHLDMEYTNVLRDHANDNKNSTTKFQLIDTSSSQPMHSYRSVLKGQFQSACPGHAHATLTHSHLPKLPHLTCLLGKQGQRPVEREYCQTHDFSAVSPAMIDIYPLVIQVIRALHKGLSRKSRHWDSFEDIVLQHEHDLSILEQLQSVYKNDANLNFWATLVDPRLMTNHVTL